MFWPERSAGIASFRPFSRASAGTVEPNCSSTSTPVTAGSAPAPTACSMPSKIRCLASAMIAVCSESGSPSIPKNFFWKEPRWSNARMYRLLSVPGFMHLSIPEARGAGSRGP